MERLRPVQVTQRLTWSIRLSLIWCWISHSMDYLWMQCLLELLLLLLKQELLLKHIFLELFVIIMSRCTSLKALSKVNILLGSSWRWLWIASGNLGLILFASDRPVNFNVSSSCCLLLNLDLLLAAGNWFEQGYWALGLLSEQVWGQGLWLSRRIDLVELLELTWTCLCNVVKHSLKILIMRQVWIRNDAI